MCSGHSRVMAEALLNTPFEYSSTTNYASTLIGASVDLQTYATSTFYCPSHATPCDIENNFLRNYYVFLGETFKTVLALEGVTTAVQEATNKLQVITGELRVVRDELEVVKAEVEGLKAAVNK